MTAAPIPLTTNTPDPTGGSGGAGGEPIIKCAGVTKVFRDFWLRNRVKAVDGIDLEIRRGEVFGLLGPNGSGKSTTIKMILGLLHPTAGRIAVFGKRPDDVATKKLIGYLPEESYLYRFLNARETLEYYGRLFHQDRYQRQRRVEKLLSYVGLEAVQRRPVGEYSKGMQRRIGIAQALINDPQLLILDEPTSGMDPIGSRQIKDLILDLKSVGKTILLCSHLLGDVEDVCDRVAIMFGGKVRASGTVDELLIRQDMTTLQTDSLDVGMIQEVEDVLVKHGKHIERVERPRQRLETLFLDIVNQAHAEGTATSGAQVGGTVPEFLVRSGEMPESADRRRLIDQLVAQPTPAAAAPAPAASPAPPAAPPPDTTLINTLLEPKAASASGGSEETGSSLLSSITVEPPKPVEPVVPPPVAAAPAPAPVLPPPPPPAPAAPPVHSGGSAGGEKPDQLFIDALTKVEPFREGQENAPKDEKG